VKYLISLSIAITFLISSCRDSGAVSENRKKAIIGVWRLKTDSCVIVTTFTDSCMIQSFLPANQVSLDSNLHVHKYSYKWLDSTYIRCYNAFRRASKSFVIDSFVIHIVRLPKDSLVYSVPEESVYFPSSRIK
jgi:hypothetical protein